MLRLVFIAVWVILVTCGALIGAAWMQTPKPAEAGPTGPSLSTVKTDFIAVSVFRGGKVDGYLSFRAVLSVPDEDRAEEIGWVISDSMNRQLPLLGSLVADPFDPAIGKTLAPLLLADVNKRLGDGTLAKIDLTDVFFDKRVQ